MDPDFWLERWRNNEIGFHQTETNFHLQKFWTRLVVSGQVLVPLCGKSRDMLWLRAQGHPVLGVELSALAVQSFFTENALQPTITRDGAFERWDSDGLTLLCGDFFDLTAAQLGAVAGVYDRAALIALPPELRQRYARHLCRLLPPSAPQLLVTMEYEQAQMPGPPFAVNEAEVRDLYSADYQINLLYTKDILAEQPRFRERGLTRLDERAYHLLRVAT